MKRSSWVVLGAIGILVVVLLYMTVSSPRQSDTEQIHLMLARTRSAIEKKDVTEAFSHVSRDYSDSFGNTYKTLRLEAMRAFRTSERLGVEIEGTSIEVQGKTAQTRAHIAVRFLTRGSGSPEVFSRDMSISFRKERSRKWLLIPVEEWRIRRIVFAPGGATDELGILEGF